MGFTQEKNESRCPHNKFYIYKILYNKVYIYINSTAFNSFKKCLAFEIFIHPCNVSYSRPLLTFPFSLHQDPQQDFLTTMSKEQCFTPPHPLDLTFLLLPLSRYSLSLGEEEMMEMPHRWLSTYSHLWIIQKDPKLEKIQESVTEYSKNYSLYRQWVIFIRRKEVLFFFTQ